MNKKTKKLNRLNGGVNNNNNNTSNKKSIMNKIKSIDRTNVANFVGKIADAPTSIPKSIYEGTESGIGIKPAMEKLGNIKNDIKNDISDSEYLNKKKKETKKGIEFIEKVIDQTTGISSDTFTQDSRCKFDIEGTRFESKDLSNVKNKLGKSLLFGDDEKFKNLVLSPSIASSFPRAIIVGCVTDILGGTSKLEPDVNTSTVFIEPNEVSVTSKAPNCDESVTGDISVTVVEVLPTASLFA